MNNPQARILVIEDDDSIPMILNGWLKKVGDTSIIIDHVTNPEEGLLRLNGASLVLLDLTIPPHWTNPLRTLGYFCPRFRDHAPVIILTGYSEGSPEADARFVSTAISEYGADAVVFKNMLTGDGLHWLFTIINAAMARRLYEGRHLHVTV